MDKDFSVALAYALQEAQHANLPHIANFLRMTAGLQQRMDYLETIAPKTKPILIKRHTLPDEQSIVGLQVQLLYPKKRGNGVHAFDLKTYVWDRPEALKPEERHRARDGYYEPFRFWMNTPDRYKMVGTGSRFEQIVDKLRKCDDLPEDLYVGSLGQKGSKFSDLGPGSRRWPDQGAIVWPDKSLLLVIRDREFQFESAKDLRGDPARSPDAAAYSWYWQSR